MSIKISPADFDQVKTNLPAVTSSSSFAVATDTLSVFVSTSSFLETVVGDGSDEIAKLALLVGVILLGSTSDAIPSLDKLMIDLLNVASDDILILPTVFSEDRGMVVG